MVSRSTIIKVVWRRRHEVISLVSPITTSSHATVVMHSTPMVTTSVMIILVVVIRRIILPVSLNLSFFVSDIHDFALNIRYFLIKILFQLLDFVVLLFNNKSVVRLLDLLVNKKAPSFCIESVVEIISISILCKLVPLNSNSKVPCKTFHQLHLVSFELVYLGFDFSSKFTPFSLNALSIDILEERTFAKASLLMIYTLN